MPCIRKKKSKEDVTLLKVSSSGRLINMIVTAPGAKKETDVAKAEVKWEYVPIELQVTVGKKYRLVIEDSRNIVQRKLKGDVSNKFSLEKVKAILSGWNSEGFKNQAEDLKKRGYVPNQCFSLVMGANIVDVILTKPDCADCMIDFIQKMQKQSKKSAVGQLDDWIMEMYQKADKDGDGSISFHEMVELLQKLNYGIKPDEAKRILNGPDFANIPRDRKGEAQISAVEFSKFLKQLVEMKESCKIFKKYSGGSDTMDTAGWIDFMKFEGDLIGDGSEVSTPLYDETPLGPWGTGPGAQPEVERRGAAAAAQPKAAQAGQTQARTTTSSMPAAQAQAQAQMQVRTSTPQVQGQERTSSPQSRAAPPGQPNMAIEPVKTANAPSSDTLEKFRIAMLRRVVASFVHDANYRAHLIFDLHSFKSLMTSTNWLSVDVPKATDCVPTMDMKQPITHYFMASSHNTYLIGNQLNGESSVEGYRNALLHNARCVELDVWDGKDGQPQVTHGHTFCSVIKFKDCLRTIRDCAFETSPYPVVLSIELHCGLPQQKLMATYLKEIFRDKLYTTPIEEGTTRLPSPEDLKYKFLIKGPKLSRTAPPVEEGVLDETLYEIDESDVEELENAEEDGAESFEAVGSGVCVEEEEEEEVEESVGEGTFVGKVSKKKKGTKKPEKKKLAPELSDLVVLFKTTGFKSFQHAKENHKPYEMVSLSEGKSKSLIGNWESDEGIISSREYAVHTQNFSVRIYPAGTRFSSTNYNPIIHWSVGCQMVALNYQHRGEEDVERDLEHGFFHDNGCSGYILKPEFLRKPMNYSPHQPDKKWRKVLNVNVLSGFQFPRPTNREGRIKDIIDPIVSVTLWGPQVSTSYVTPVVKNNGFHPVFKTSFSFTIENPELSLLRFKVVDDECGLFVAQSTIRVTAIRPGLRSVPLRRENGERDDMARLFVVFKWDSE